MELDDELCLCFHVTQRKVLKFIRLEQPRSLSQLSDCYGAGTGCGWCRPFLKKLFESSQTDQDRVAEIPSAADLPSAVEYAANRSAYVKAGKGTPPASS